jgi:uncharacterized protein (TIGR01319 family)
MGTYLLLDVGSTFTKGLIVDTEAVKILGRAQAPTTAQTDIVEGIEAVKAKMADVIAAHPLTATRLCSSAKGGLKMIAVGLVPDLTLKAATLACTSAGAKLVGTYSFTLSEREVDAIETAQCDVLLLAGGTDGGNKEVILANAKALCRLTPRFPIIYAGNKSAADEAVPILRQHGFTVSVADNVMPSTGVLQVDSAREAIRAVFLDTIVKAKGLSTVASIIENVVLPTPSSVLDALSLLAHGTPNQPGWGDLMAIDIGGATTDVYSMHQRLPVSDNAMVRGLPDPLIKRTVEGDLGVRFNAASVIEHLSHMEAVDHGLSDYAHSLALQPHQPANPGYDVRLAGACARLAAQRHAGRLESAYTPMGRIDLQVGKDLRPLKTVIGIGGPLIHAMDAQEILSQVRYNPAQPDVLLPLDPHYALDKLYVISGLGLLAKSHPDAVLTLLKQTVEELTHDQS